jgi:archaellum biogenesis ATPase FlaH
MLCTLCSAARFPLSLNALQFHIEFVEEAHNSSLLGKNLTSLSQVIVITVKNEVLVNDVLCRTNILNRAYN